MMDDHVAGDREGGVDMQEWLKVAMPKGRIYKQASRLFRDAGLPIRG